MLFHKSIEMIQLLYDFIADCGRLKISGWLTLSNFGGLPGVMSKVDEL
jgi:hypothetical protein